MSSLTFCHPAILQFLQVAAVLFVIDCKELKLAQTTWALPKTSRTPKRAKQLSMATIPLCFEFFRCRVDACRVNFHVVRSALQYSETCIKRTLFIKRTVAEVPKCYSLIYFKWNLYQADTSIKRTRTPKKYLKWSFLLFPTCIKRTLVIKFHHPTSQTPEMRKIAIHKFFNFYFKKRDLKNLFD